MLAKSSLWLGDNYNLERIGSTVTGARHIGYVTEDVIQ